MYCRHFRRFVLWINVRHKSLSFSSISKMHQIKKLKIALSCSLNFKLGLPFRKKIGLFCLKICNLGRKPRKSLKNILFPKFPKKCVWLLQNCRLSFLTFCVQMFFLSFHRLFAGNILFNWHVVTRNCIPVVFQSEGSESNSLEYLIYLVHEGKAMKKVKPIKKIFQLHGI